MSVTPPSQPIERIALAGGCFWCTESVFSCLKGVLELASGYANGELVDPSYEAVCTGRTGHAECVMLTFDPAVLTLSDVLEVFFATHDPTQLNRQGHDVGTQYRSAVFCTDEVQLARVQDHVAGWVAQGAYAQPIVTQIEMLRCFYAAEAYHQRFFERNPSQGYCLAVAAPKVSKVREVFTRLLK